MLPWDWDSRFAVSGHKEIMKAKWIYLKHSPGFQSSPELVMWRLLVWRVRCLVGLPSIVVLRSLDIRLKLPPEWRGIAKLLYVFREQYEPELLWLKDSLRPGDVFIDAGASLGVYSLAASRRVGEEGKVMAFEPSQVFYPQLEGNLLMNGCENVVPFQFALSNSEGNATLYDHPDPTRYSLGGLGHGERVRTRKLGNVLGEAGVRQLDLVKLDVEGAEELILRGAAEIIREFRPAIIFEINPSAARMLRLRPEGAHSLLSDWGYRFSRLTGSGTLEEAEGFPSGGNLIASHPSNPKR